jgi:hypothetical protein
LPARTFATSLGVSFGALVGVAGSPFGPCVVPRGFDDLIGAAASVASSSLPHATGAPPKASTKTKIQVRLLATLAIFG